MKRENFEWVIQKAVEVGTAEIVPIISKRTVKLLIRNERMEKIIREAAEQSGRGILPKLGKVMALEKAVDEAAKNDVNIFFDNSGESIKDIENLLAKAKKIGLFIGPEGGWDEEEIAMAREKNFKIVSLGKLTLRAETAAVVGAFLILTK